ncbi:unnamed protein product [Enterobius vermicularis]|uniref:ANK_REP_REGION domain-containing protein n=1 Tax=Enterobius vermicularis TaxID=51028 RepID=A0A0N4V6N5_ENTVE|nr:unnamed protein product [Enterobius vermicularis]
MDLAEVEQKGVALCCASSGGHLEIVKYLLEQGVSVHAKDKKQRTALWLASSNGHLNVAKYLLNKGAEVNVKDKNRRSPIDVASSEDIVDLLKRVEERRQQERSDLEYARNLQRECEREEFAFSNDEEPRRRSSGANLCDPMEKLKLACAEGDLDTVQELITCEVDTETKDDSKRTPLWIASSFGCVDVVRCLLDAGADANSKDIDENTPLHIAALNGHTGVARRLILGGARRDEINKKMVKFRK